MPQLLDEPRVLRELEGLHPMRLQAVRTSDAVDGGVSAPLRPRHRAHAPLRGGRRRGVQRCLDYGLDLVRPDRGLAARAGLFVVESGHAAADEALALQEHGRAAHADLAGDSGIRPSGGGEQDEAGPLDQLLGGVARAHEEFEALALVGVEGEGLYRLEHG